MAIAIRMPEVLAGALEGVISRWAVSEGDVIAVGEVLCEIETDKASVEYQAEEAGTVARLLISEGDSVDVGDLIAVFARDGDTEADIEQALVAAGAKPVSAGDTEASAPEQPVVPTSTSLTPEVQPENIPPQAGGRIFASPIVRKLAKEYGIELHRLTGSGPAGRIVRKDLESFRSQTSQSASPAPSTATPSGPGFTEIPHSSMRRAIARRLTESKSTVPHFYLKQDCRVDKLLELRSELNETLGARTSVNDWILKAVAHALMAVPQANVIWTEGAMRQFHQADIAVAVATEGGLYTPVLRGVNAMSVVQISQSVRLLAEKARSGTIKQDEIEGGSFAVTNLGMLGTQEFSAILNPPQSGILAVGAAREAAVVVDGSLEVGHVLSVTLSADHRPVDGALAAEWMAAFKTALEHPLCLVLEKS